MFGGIERETKRCFLVPILNRNQETLIDVITNYILPGTTIISAYYEGFQSLRIDHNIHIVDPYDPRIHMQNVERLWLKVGNGICHYERKSTAMAGYLAEFMFNYRTSNKLETFLLAIKEF